MAELPSQRAGTIIIMVSSLSWVAQTAQVCLLKSLNPSPGDSWLSLSRETAACFGEPWCWDGDQREGAARPLPSSLLPMLLVGCSSPSPPTLPAPAGGCTPAPGTGVRTGDHSPGQQCCLPCLGQPASCHRVKLPKERREEDRKNNHKNLFHAAWIPPCTQQCFWTADL